MASIPSNSLRGAEALASSGGEPTALLSFWLGPVQSFISTAHTTRDLWTGSYVLSWLTLHAIRSVVEDCSDGRQAILFPDVTSNALLTYLSGGSGRKPIGVAELHACLPNLFLAQVPAQRAATIADNAERAAREEWHRIADAVRKHLDTRWNIGGGGTWDQGWKDQIDGYFDMRCMVLPHDNSAYAVRFDRIGKLFAADKMIRHIPPSEEEHDTRPKCSLMGSYSQMGPVGEPLSNFGQWWAGAREKIDGAIRSNERLCAVSLTKRLAWRAYLRRSLALDSDVRNFPDTATVAARHWMSKRPAIERAIDDPKWSGQWLHWATPDQGVKDGEPRIPDELFRDVRAARADEGVPLYYAVLIMDGDNMGRTVRAVARHGESAHRAFSGAMAEFASGDVPPVVEELHPADGNAKVDYRGTLIYSGGDDVLAMLPTGSALACALEIQAALTARLNKALPSDIKESKETAAQTMSAGIVVAHYKEDLRFVLQQARAAEKQAKDAGKNAVCLRILKRSGEHDSAVCGWGIIPTLQRLIALYANPELKLSDGWAHQLTGESQVLGGFDQPSERPAVAKRIATLLDRSDGTSQEMNKLAMVFWNGFEIEASRRPHVGFDAILKEYCFLMRAVSFLARGREASR